MRRIALLVAVSLLVCLAVTWFLFKRNAAKPNLSGITSTQPASSTQPRDEGTSNVDSTGNHVPKVSFFGNGDYAHHVVFVIDASGLMAMAGKNGSVFDDVRAEMIKSISHLKAEQDFHIVFFQDGPLIQLPPTQLQPASPENLAAAEKWINDANPHGTGDNPVPAIIRAFDSLGKADKSRKGKIIFFLTFGPFPPSDALFQCVKDRNRKNDVQVFTYLLEPDNQDTIKLMNDIAIMTGGKYKDTRVEDFVGR